MMCNFLLDLNSAQVISLGKYYFLNSQKAYDACKRALSKIEITQIHLDLSDEKSCANLAAALKENNARFALCNFTNIHDYTGVNVIVPVSTLLENSGNCAIMFADGPKTKLHANLFIGTYNYFRNIMSIKRKIKGPSYASLVKYLEPSDNNLVRFFRAPHKKNNNKNEFCYVAIPFHRCDNPHLLAQQLADGIMNINAGSPYFRAFDTEEEAVSFYLDKMKQDPNRMFMKLDEKTYLILKFRGNKGKINRYIVCNDTEIGDPKTDRDIALSKIECAFNFDKSIVVQKTKVDAEKEITRDERFGTRY